MDTSILRDIGLTDSEINAYLALLELGSSTTGPIVDRSGATSSKIYEILDRLIQKGLVSYVIQAGTKYFEAVDPQRLLVYLHEKEAQLKEKEAQLKTLLPELQLKQTLSKYKSEAQIYKGMKGAKTAFDDVLKVCKKGDTIFVFVVGDVDPILNRFFIHHYAERAKRGIKTKTIFSEAGRHLYESRKNIPLFEGKVIGATSSAATIQIYGNKVNLRMGNSDNIVCVVIENEKLAKAFKEQFDLMWDQRVATYEGEQAVRNAYQSVVETTKPSEEIVVFATKPPQQSVSDYNVLWNQQLAQKAKRVRLLYSGETEANKKRASEIAEVGCETKILPTPYASPISTVVAGSTILHSVWQEKPTTFKIENKVVAEALRENFEYLWNQKVHVFEGVKQATHFFREILATLKAGEEYYVINGNYGTKAVPQLRDFFFSYHKKRSAKGIKAKFLFNQNLKDKVNHLALQPSEYKFLPAILQSPLQITFYQTKLYISLWEQEAIGFLIENKKLVDAFKSYFDLLWNQKW